MIIRGYFFLVMCVFTFFSISFAGTTEIQNAFTDEELKKFCQELPIVLAPMNDEERRIGGDFPISGDVLNTPMA